MKIIELLQGTPEWLDYRKTKICASDIASIMGSNRFKPPRHCYDEKTGNKEIFVSDAMRRGVALEPEARSRVNEVLEEHYAPLCVEHENGFMFASLDGYSEHAHVPIIEIKCPGLETHRIACDDKVPPIYYPQLQFQMYVTGAQVAYYISYMPEDLIPLALVLIKRDEEFCERMAKEAHDFYIRLINFDPPECAEKDKEPRVIEDAYLIMLSKMRTLNQYEINKLEKENDEIDEKLKAACSGESIIIGNLKITKSERKGCIDYDTIPELNGVDTEKYRKPSKETWTIREINHS